MSKIKNGGLDQYGAGPFEQQQFGTAGIKGVKSLTGEGQNYTFLSVNLYELIECVFFCDVMQK